MTGQFFDSSIDLVLPGAQPLVVQQTFCNFFNWHFSHLPTLEVGESTEHLHALYTDDNGSGMPFRSHMSHREPIHGYFTLTKEALDHLTNNTGKISGKTRWSNSRLYFNRNGKNKLYSLSFGSGTKRLFKRYKKGHSKHHSGAPLGKFHLIREHSANGNKYRYRYTQDHVLRKVEAVNSKGKILAELHCDRSKKKEVWTVGNMSVAYVYDYSVVAKNNFLAVKVQPSHGIPAIFTLKGSGTILKELPNDRSLSVHFSHHFFDAPLQPKVVKLCAPIGDNAKRLPIYEFTYRIDKDKDHGETSVTNAAGEETLYKYDIKHKRLKSITTLNQDKTVVCKERFFWHRPDVSRKLEKANEKHPYFPFPQMGSHTDVHSEFLLCSRVFAGDGIYYFCRQLEYDDYGNVEKNHLWGNLTGRNNVSLSLTNGIPKDNGCEVYTRILRSTHDGRNLPAYEDDGRKWVRQTYSSRKDKPISRLTGSGEKILKREFFSYDNQGVLINETWDDGTAEKIDDLTNVTERHVRITEPRKKMPIGLPETVTDYYCDLNTNKRKNVFVKKYVNVHSPEGQLLSQHHYDSNKQLAFTLQWEYDRLGNATLVRNALGETITRQFDDNGNKIMKIGVGSKKEFNYDYSNRLCEEKETWEDVPNIYFWNSATTSLAKKLPP